MARANLSLSSYCTTKGFNLGNPQLRSSAGDSAATWLKKNATTNWATPGGEYNPGAISEQPAAIGQWTRFTATNLGFGMAGWLQRRRQTYNYDVDGNATTAAIGAAPNPETWIKYAGGHDIGGGLYHYGARFYQPSTGRWTQQDPLQMPGDLRQHNRYGYAAGDPVNYTTRQVTLPPPSGLDWQGVRTAGRA